MRVGSSIDGVWSISSAAAASCSTANSWWRSARTFPTRPSRRNTVDSCSVGWLRRPRDCDQIDMTFRQKSRPSTHRIPIADPGADLAHLRSDLLAAMARVLDAGDYVLGQEVAEFERGMARRIGVPGTVGVAS